jgi:hypothetical protein
VLASWSSQALDLGVQLAQQARPSARVYTEPSVLYSGRPFQLKFEASGGDIEFPLLPQIDGITIDLRQRPSASSQISIINGRRKVRIEERGYKATASRAGAIIIPPLEFTIDGEPIYSAAVALTVKDPPQRGSTPGGKPVREDYLFIQLVLDKSVAYQGEPVLMKQQVWQLDGWGATFRGWNGMDRHPATEGFYSAGLEQREGTGTLNGYNYKVTEFVSILYPTRAGDLEVGSWHWEGYANVRTGRSQPRFIQRSQRLEFVLDTPPWPLTVKPLPDGPPDFSGAVGQYTLDATLERTTALQGVPIDLYVTIRGDGNPAAVVKPSFDVPEWAYFSEPELTSEELTAQDGLALGVSKRFAYTVTPLDVGDVTLGPITFTSFNPVRGVYETATVGPYEITVRKSAEDDQPFLVSPELPGEERAVDIIGQDIGSLMTRPPGLRADESFATVAPLAFLLPIVLYVGLRVYASRRRRFTHDTGFARAYHAKSVAAKRLEHLNSSEDPSEALCGILTDCVRDLFDVEAAGLTSADVEQILREKGVAAENRENLLTILRRCERARYASQELSREERSALIHGTEAAVAQLDEAVKGRGKA